jgi:hypothetical protein
MGEVINLRIARKARSRSEKEIAAQENRLKHGRSKAERMQQDLAEKRLRAKHDGHKLTPEKPDE